MLSAATTHSALRPRLYSTRKAVIGEPPLALGIQVTYAELSVAMEMVGRSGASGTGEKKQIGIKLVPVITASEFMQTWLRKKKKSKARTSQGSHRGMYTYCLAP